MDEHAEEIDQSIKTIIVTPYFRTVDTELLKEILQNAMIFNLGSAEFLIRESNKSDRMVYILLEGEFDVVADKKFILKIDQPGQTIGEMAAINPNTPRSADVLAVSPSKVIAIESSFLDKTDAKSQKLASSFYKMFSHVLSEKIRITTERAKLYENAVLEKNEIDKYNKELNETSKDLKRELEDKLAQIKLFSQVVESNLDAIIISDKKGNLQSVNCAFLDLFGYDQDEVSELKLKTLFENLTNKNEDYADLFSEGWQGQKSAFRKDQTKFPSLISVSPIKTSKERLVFAIVVRDITQQKEYEENILKANMELKQTYQELENTLQELEKSNKTKDRFFSNISTQLMTPLDSMKNYSEMLKKSLEKAASKKDAQGFLVQMMTEGNKMEKLVENMITMAELTSGMNLTFKINKLEAFFHNLKKQTAKRGNLIFDIDPALSVMVADSEKLTKAFVDMIDYITKEKDVGIDIYLTCQLNTKKKLIEIDISCKDLRFFHANKTIEAFGHLSDGVELSFQKGDLLLPLAKRIIEFHQGEMAIVSVEDEEKISIRLMIDPDAEYGLPIKVMLVDENEWDRMILKGIMENEFVQIDVYEFNSQMSALNALSAIKPNLVVVDPVFSDQQWSFDDFLSKMLEHNPGKMSTLVVSEKLPELDFRNKIISLGITDFVFKPFTVEDALFKINSIIDNQQKLSLLSNNVKKAEKSAATDGLTGLFNRKYFDNFIHDQLMKAEIQKGYCSIIMMDVDNFKHYNDTNGHQMGDEVLKKIAKILHSGIRQSDMVARYGGEEFVIVLPGTAKKMGEKIADKLRQAIDKSTFSNEKKQPNGSLTASFGVASFPENGSSPEVVLKGADHCLYLAKERGRNRVVGAEGIIEL